MRRNLTLVALTGALLVVVSLAVGSTLADALAPPAGADVVPGQVPVCALATTGWSSGWVSMTAGSLLTLTHNLGGDVNNYAVELWFLDTATGGLGINQRGYGGFEDNGSYAGAAWQNLTTSTITVLRHAHDTWADMVRVRIWIPDPLPTYCSPWTGMGLNSEKVFTHTVGGNPDDYSVGLWFSSTVGINQRAFGGLEIAGSYRGALWRGLNASTVRVVRFGDDPFASQIRVCVNIPDPPSFDSGWVNLTPGAVTTITHNLGGNPNTYSVRCNFRDSGGVGINAQWAGGEMDGSNPVGANWQNLTASTISIYRQSGDSYADQVHCRMWAQAYSVYLPIVLSNYAPTTELAYDDGVAESWQSQDAQSGFAVRFTTPGASARLSRARYYLNAATPSAAIQVHVWDASHNDLIAPFTVTPQAGIHWLDVDLSSYNLTVSGDFYVGFLSTVAYQPDIGVDASAPDGRSFEVPWMAAANDYMIRVSIIPQ